MIEKCWQGLSAEAYYVDPYMHTETCIELGVIQRKQGLKGEVVAWLHQEVPLPATLKTLFIQLDHTLVPYGVVYFSLKHRQATIKLQGVDDPKVAHELKGQSIFVPQAVLPQLTPPEVQLAKLLRYQVTDVQVGSLGPVCAIYTPPQQQLLAVDYQGQELLIPYHKDIIKNVAHAQQSIIVALPKGFIEASF